MIVYKITPYDNGHADLVRIIPDLTFEVNAFPSRPHLLYFPLLRSNVGIAHAAQVIARVSEILTSSHAPPSFRTLEHSRSDKDAMIVYTSTQYDYGHADLVKVILDLKFEEKAFQCRQH